jgi:hypothetical protein
MGGKEHNTVKKICPEIFQNLEFIVANEILNFLVFSNRRDS